MTLRAAAFSGEIRASSHLTGAPVTYYDVIEPAGGATKATMVLVHGGAHTGSCYLQTADDRAGWAYDFARHGHRVVVPDWPGRGRSGYVPEVDMSGQLVCDGLVHVIRAQPEPVVLVTHSMSGQFGWKLLEMAPREIAAIVGVAPGPPGNMQGEPIVVAQTPEEIQLRFFATSPIVTVRPQQPFVPTLPWSKHKLVGDGTQFPLDRIATYVASLNPVPSRLLAERANFRGAGLKVADAGIFANRRILLFAGTNDADHPPEFERGLRDWFAGHGARVELYLLGEHGIHGNGHMPMLERNSSQIADFIESKLTG